MADPLMGHSVETLGHETLGNEKRGTARPFPLSIL